MKKTITILLVVLLFNSFLTLPFKANAEDTVSYTVTLKIGSNTVYVNGQPKTIDVAPYIDPKTNRTLVPVRFVAEGLGGAVSWHNREKFVGVLVGNRKVGMFIGKNTAEVSEKPITFDTGLDVNKQVTMDQAPVITNGRTMIPLRFVSESVGADVQWNGETKEITISLSYKPVGFLEPKWGLIFDRYVEVKDSKTLSGFIIPQQAPFVYDPINKAILTYGVGGFRYIEEHISGYKLFPEFRYMKNIYLVKIDALTGILVSYQNIFTNDYPINLEKVGNLRAAYLEYDHGYLYAGGIADTEVYSLSYPSIFEYYEKKNIYPEDIVLYKIEPTTLKVVWKKKYNIQDTFFGNRLVLSYNDRIHYLWIYHAFNLNPPKFSQDGSVIMLTLGTLDLQSGIFDGKKIRGSEWNSALDFAAFLGINTKDGSVRWKTLHDAWDAVAARDGAMRMYGNYVVFLEPPSMSFLSNFNLKPGDSYYSYQYLYIKSIADKIREEIISQYGRLPEPESYNAIGGPYPVRLLAMDINTGKTVWERFFYEINTDFLPDDSFTLPPIVNGVLYLPVSMYDPEVQDFGVELIGIRVTDGKTVMMTHKLHTGSPGTNKRSTMIELLKSFGTPITLNVNGENRTKSYWAFSHADFIIKNNCIIGVKSNFDGTFLAYDTFEEFVNTSQPTENFECRPYVIFSNYVGNRDAGTLFPKEIIFYDGFNQIPTKLPIQTGIKDEGWAPALNITDQVLTQVSDDTLFAKFTHISRGILVGSIIAFNLNK
ncbi:copper amine oxidase N-terminal domain-containing protein [Caldisericum exile]|uniref:Copper amine oxidase-like N-terminal domain-containing protein n=1 Tax=Caldisericum exile (strain DSM 21853 / NBRC 104410 / AZM16c01) TaxID=511051 RepID=A0A7U6GE21_CALEA|nr:copper amine oxidase N-terminal domain-containing protein [Caldisericum exile]BAL80685.1 hypothetical protein CSE_05590 [Caldisericum exile AZM16c01]